MPRDLTFGTGRRRTRWPSLGRMPTDAPDEHDPLDPDARPRRSRGRRLLRRVVLGLLALLGVVLVAAVGFLLWFHIPSNAAGLAAKSVCSAAFVAGRDGSASELMEQDVLPASPVLKAISTTVDRDRHTVTSRFLGLFERRASLTTDRGCVLDLPPDPAATPYAPAAPRTEPWPDGDATAAASELPDGVDTEALGGVVDRAFAGTGDPAQANARGLAVVQDGRLVVERDGAGIPAGTALHGWSMTKTVAAMLAWKKLDEVGLDLSTPVVDAFPAGREPGWVADWRSDDRARITVADLLYMRPGLAVDETYTPWGDVVQMLYGERDMPGWAAAHGTDHEPGTYWEYLSATSNILAQVVRAQFDSDEAYWSYPRTTLFEPLGLTSATLETDTDGTWVASSYLWASAGDWARLGQLLLDDGRWEDQQVYPSGFLDLATTPAVATGEGHGYGAQTWLFGDPVGGECKDTPGVPADTVAMEGHWGQEVVVVPSRRAVVVRLGWTFDSSTFDGCRLVADVLATLAP